MSSLRDVRLLVARSLDEPVIVKAAVLNLLNVIDTVLDANGFDDSGIPEIQNALKTLDSAILGVTLDDMEVERIEEDDDYTDLDDLEDDDDDDND